MAQDRQLTAALLKINGLDDFAPFRKWLSDELEASRNQLEAHKEVELIYRAQGRVRMLKELKDLLSRSPEMASKA